MKLFLIDAIGPFFMDYNKRVVNWSKIPFDNLENAGELATEKIKAIFPVFEQYIKSVKKLGFNAITLDDVAHLTNFDFYPEALQRKIRQYQTLYSTIFEYALANDLKIFVTTDVMFFNSHIKQEVGYDWQQAISLLHEAVLKTVTQFGVEGVIFRIGETDGEDVEGDFKSKMIIRTPDQANRFIKQLLPDFEKFNKYLVLRNWTVGCYPIGDLIWNQKTQTRTLQGVDSPNFIISMKYGDTDFFSCLELNPLLIRCRHNLLLELQTRRERECFGVFPYYVGWDYETYRNQLQNNKNLIGISVWGQTGGWSRNNHLTFIDNVSVWNELNTAATLQIFKDNLTADQAILRFFQDERYLDFLKQFNRLFLKLLYIEDFAHKTLYFRRTRIPPLLWLVWDYITINPLMTSIYRTFSTELSSLDESAIERIYRMGTELRIANIEYCYDTLRLFLACRKTLLGQYEEYRLLEYIGLFRRKYRHCNIKFAIKKGTNYIFWVRLLLKIFIRTKPDYRVIDRILLNRTFAYAVFKVLVFFTKGRMPKFTDKHAMKLEILFK
jgi:hypothetical protein